MIRPLKVASPLLKRTLVDAAEVANTVPAFVPVDGVMLTPTSISACAVTGLFHWS
jgi:hypothetical protein